jgi:arylsulfatase
MKVKELLALFDTEAKKYEVYPLDDHFEERGVMPDRPCVTKGKTSFIYYPEAVRIPEGATRNLKATFHTITAVLVNFTPGKT